MIFLRVLFLLAVLAGAVSAQEPELRSGETLLTADELVDLTAGNTLIFYDRGESRFSAGGSYSYSYADNGGTAFGIFEVRPDGRVCIEFRNGFDRCDFYAKRDGLHYLITEQGYRFPFRMEFSIER